MSFGGFAMYTVVDFRNTTNQMNENTFLKNLISAIKNGHIKRSYFMDKFNLWP